VMQPALQVWNYISHHKMIEDYKGTQSLVYWLYYWIHYYRSPFVLQVKIFQLFLYKKVVIRKIFLPCHMTNISLMWFFFVETLDFPHIGKYCNQLISFLFTNLLSEYYYYFSTTRTILTNLGFYLPHRVHFWWKYLHQTSRNKSSRVHEVTAKQVL